MSRTGKPKLRPVDLRRKGATDKERLFVAAYVGGANGNATQAAIQAGYSRKTAAQIAYRLLRKVQIRRAIDKHVNREERRAVLTADERDVILSMIARGDVDAAVAERIRAIAELNKCTGRHSVKHVHGGKLTLEQILSASREPDPERRTA